MKHRTRFGQQGVGEIGQKTESTPLEFSSPEEMLRHDAIHTPVPPAVESRLRASASSLAPVQPWWRRLLGR